MKAITGKGTIYVLTLMWGLALFAGCQSQAPSSSQPTPPATDSQQKFMHTDDFYGQLAASMDAAMLPLFENVGETTPQDQGQYFFYFVTQQGLYNSGEDWWVPQEEVYRIPAQAMTEVLQTYLGVEQFDPVAAFGDSLKKTEYAKVPLGYDTVNEQYVVPLLNGGEGGRSTQVLEKELLGENKIMVTVGFYDMQQDTDLYKKKVLTLQETEDTGVYTLLSAIDINLINGNEVVVYGHKEKSKS